MFLFIAKVRKSKYCLFCNVYASSYGKAAELICLLESCEENSIIKLQLVKPCK